ncbi:MAG: DJ-1/PfpI family protein [Candidatus Margulisiibacteriota bacterium]
MAKRVLMIIAFEGFRDEEYTEPKKVLEKSRIEVTTASSQVGIAKGKLGLSAKVDLPLKEVNVPDYDAIIFVGGPGSYDYFDDPLAQGIAKDAVKEQKILAAICAAPSILANAGLLKGIKATCFSGESENLKNKGAHYSPSGLEVDGKIITADGPAHAKQFGEKIVKALS